MLGGEEGIVCGIHGRCGEEGRGATARILGFARGTESREALWLSCLIFWQAGKACGLPSGGAQAQQQLQGGSSGRWDPVGCTGGVG